MDDGLKGSGIVVSVARHRQYLPFAAGVPWMTPDRRSSRSSVMHNLWITVWTLGNLVTTVRLGGGTTVSRGRRGAGIAAPIVAAPQSDTVAAPDSQTWWFAIMSPARIHPSGR